MNPKLIELMERLDKEETDQLIEMEECFAEQDRKHTEMKNRADLYRDEYYRHMDCIKKNLDYLVSHKHTIEKAFEQTENPTGLPVPQEHHSAVVELVTKLTNFISNINNVINVPNTISPDTIHEDVINIMKKVENDLKGCRTEVTTAQDLFYNVKSLSEELSKNSMFKKM